MALYLAAAVVGVVVIVFLVIHLTKSGANKAATGSSTPSTGTTAAGGQAGTNSYVFTQAAKVGTSFPLNKTATKRSPPAAGEPVGSHRRPDQDQGIRHSRARSWSASTT